MTKLSRQQVDVLTERKYDFQRWLKCALMALHCDSDDSNNNNHN